MNNFKKTFLLEDGDGKTKPGGDMTLNNLYLFITKVSWRFLPWEWGSVWQQINDFHEQEVRKGIWQLKKEGKIREDEDGKLWIN